jgi:hypothetical protein
MEYVAAARRLKKILVDSARGPSSSLTGAWAAVSGLIVLVIGGLAVDAPGSLQLLYPLGTLAVGALLYLRYPVLYLGFVWWIWFLTPAVRRLVDYQQGWDPENPVMLAPLLVTGLSALTLLRRLRELRRRRFLPFGLILLGVSYGYGVGVFAAGPFAATYDLIKWSAPVVFAFHLVVQWQNYPAYRRVVNRTFVLGVLIMGLYGLLQYFALPPWDRHWLLNAPMTSTSSLNYISPGDSNGSAGPFWIRVFSTLNSQAPFAVVMMAGLLLLFSGGGLLRWPAVGVGYASFLLSMVRSAWGGWMVGLLFILARGKGFRLSLLAILAVLLLSGGVLLFVEPAAGPLRETLKTFVNLQHDYSLRVRFKFLVEIYPQALFDPVGNGLGSTGAATKLNNPEGELGRLGDFDTGFLNVPFVLGWFGSLPYVAGLVWLLFYALRQQETQFDPFAVACQGIVLAVLCQLIFANTLVGVQGMVFWFFTGLSLAARAYHSHEWKMAGSKASWRDQDENLHSNPQGDQR